ncbi:MAG: hypothetical protein IKG94_07435 [Candidatus Methanomethylophilaceae archaeon]|nr:hypothetical protein [Candidatus Methanomethylophilaceae archaeon]
MDKRTAVEHQVMTCKTTGQIFEEVERFRSDSRLETRSASLNVLVSVGLWALGRLGGEECAEILGSHGIVGMHVLPARGIPEAQGVE